MHNSFADAYQRSWLLQTILVSHFNGYILIAIYIMFKGKRNAPRLNYNNQLVLEKVSTMHLVSYTPLVEKQCILWQKNGRKHPGAPKYILQDIETKQVSLFFFFFFFVTNTKYTLNIHRWTFAITSLMDENEKGYERFVLEAHVLPEGNYGHHLIVVDQIEKTMKRH